VASTTVSGTRRGAGIDGVGRLGVPRESPGAPQKTLIGALEKADTRGRDRRQHAHARAIGAPDTELEQIRIG
jgi:hypothetical protein